MYLFACLNVVIIFTAILNTGCNCQSTKNGSAELQRFDGEYEYEYSDEIGDEPKFPPVKSSPNCPEPYRGSVPFVKFGNASRFTCYRVGFKGPCERNMVIFPQKGSDFGFCDCKCDAYFPGFNHSPRSFCTGKTSKGRRTLAYVEKFRSCQPLFEQGLCPRGQWLIFDEDPKKGPVCKRSKCRSTGSGLVFYDKEIKDCRKVGQSCQREYFGRNFKATYQIHDSDWVPICTNNNGNQQADGNPGVDSFIRRLPCRSGERLNSLGRCAEISEEGDDEIG